MKALSFIEFWNQHEVEYSLFSESDMFRACAKHIIIAQKYHDFIFQPFKPEMITEYFDNIDFYYSADDLFITLFDGGIWFLKLRKEYIKNIDNIITACNLSGMYPIWSEKARKQFEV